MKKVIVQYLNETVTFDNVTEINGFLAFDMFENYIGIYQGSKQTRIKQYEIISFKVEA